MRVLLDTNLALRLAEVGHPTQPTAVSAIDALDAGGHQTCVVPQVCFELWVVATRPTAGRGLGWHTRRAAAELSRLQRLFTLFPDTPAILPAWEALVAQHDVKGKTAHDARLVAAMLVHGINAILTFNGADFARHTSVRVLDPAAVAAGLVP